MRATSFISLSESAGDCAEVPLSITSVYSLDRSGHWLGNSLYNPSSAYYTFDMSNFLKNTADYKTIIAAQKDLFYQLSTIAKTNEIANNLLYWVTWSQVVNDGNSTQKWTFTGDAKVLLDRMNYVGAMGSYGGDCVAESTVTYNAATGKFLMSYSHSTYVSTSSCNSIVAPTTVGYEAAANGDTFTMRWDGVSLVTAKSVNAGVCISSSSHSVIIMPLLFDLFLQFQSGCFLLYLFISHCQFYFFKGIRFFF